MAGNLWMARVRLARTERVVWESGHDGAIARYARFDPGTLGMAQGRSVLLATSAPGVLVARPRVREGRVSRHAPANTHPSQAPGVPPNVFPPRTERPWGMAPVRLARTER